MVQAVIPESLIAERHRLGLDKKDEMWEGVLHMVPPASEEHQRLEAELVTLLLPLAKQQGLHARTDTGVFDPAVADDSSYRTPDLVVYGEDARSQRGVEGRAVLAIEVRSPRDESFDKIPFYARVGVAEFLIIDRDTKDVRRWQANPEAVLVEQEPGPEGWHTLAGLPLAFQGGDGRLRVRTGDRVEEL